MTDIQLSIEGKGAVLATEELLEIPGISGSWETPSENQRELVLATVATIIGITTGTIAIAEKIYTWHQKYRKQQQAQNTNGYSVEKVLIVGKSGQRLLLENATVEQIHQIIDH
jgi:hypothetical protein